MEIIAQYFYPSLSFRFSWLFPASKILSLDSCPFPKKTSITYYWYLLACACDTVVAFSGILFELQIQAVPVSLDLILEASSMTLPLFCTYKIPNGLRSRQFLPFSYGQQFLKKYFCPTCIGYVFELMVFLKIFNL